MINTKVEQKHTTCLTQDTGHTSILYTKLVCLIGIALCANLLFTEFAFATATFDLDRGVTGGTSWIIDGVKTHWGKGVLLSGVGLALFGEGDARQRAQRAAIGCAAGSAVILGLIAALTT